MTSRRDIASLAGRLDAAADSLTKTARRIDAEWTDAQFKQLRDRLYKIGKTRLIDRLENEMINAGLDGNKTKQQRIQSQLEWVRRQSDWGDKGQR